MSKEEIKWEKESGYSKKYVYGVEDGIFYVEYYLYDDKNKRVICEIKIPITYMVDNVINRMESLFEEVIKENNLKGGR